MARKANNSIFEIKDGGGLLWSKLPAKVPHCVRTRDLLLGASLLLFGGGGDFYNRSYLIDGAVEQ